MKVLLAADGSKCSMRAVKYLASNRAMFGAKPEFHLLNVHSPLPSHVAGRLSRSVIQRYHGDAARKALAGAERLLDSRRIAYREVRLVGDAGTVISAYAKRGKFSLVIMGSRGQGILGSLVLGSVAAKVLANCRVPTLIIR